MFYKTHFLGAIYDEVNLPDDTIEHVTATIANIKKREIKGIASEVSGVRLASKKRYTVKPSSTEIDIWIFWFDALGRRKVKIANDEISTQGIKILMT